MVSGYDAQKILKSANIWQSYSKNKSGPDFLTHSVVQFCIVDLFWGEARGFTLKSCGMGCVENRLRHFQVKGRSSQYGGLRTLSNKI